MSGAIDDHAFKDMRAWGANVVRLQVFPVGWARRYAGGKSLWDGWPVTLDSVEAFVRAAGAAGLKVVVDLHEAPMPGVPNDRSAMWQSADLAPNFCHAWADIARRLLPLRSVVWAYDLYNEPLNRDEWPRPPTGWRPLADAIVRTIRTIDADTWLVYEVGPGSTFTGFENLTPFGDHRMIYGAHIYEPGAFLKQGMSGEAPAGSLHYPGRIGLTYWDRGRLETVVAPAVAFQAHYHIPVFIGEFSVIRWAPHDDAVRWLSDVVSIMEEHRWSWCYHAFREYNGWSLEYDEKPWHDHDADPGPVSYVTDRAKVIRDALQANWR
jgi:endoglucanase